MKTFQTIAQTIEQALAPHDETFRAHHVPELGIVIARDGHFRGVLAAADGMLVFRAAASNDVVASGRGPNEVVEVVCRGLGILSRMPASHAQRTVDASGKNAPPLHSPAAPPSASSASASSTRS